MFSAPVVEIVDCDVSPGIPTVSPGHAIGQLPTGVCDMSRLVCCEDCGHKVSKDAEACPGCGKQLKPMAIRRQGAKYEAAGSVIAVIGMVVAIIPETGTTVSGLGFAAMVIGFIVFLAGRFI